MSLTQEVEQICESVCRRLLDEWQQSFGTPSPEIDAQAVELRRKLALINAKERISTAEAALLLNCSDGHVRNLVKRAKKKQAKRPIPFRDLDGVTVFNRVELLEWVEKKSEAA